MEPNPVRRSSRARKPGAVVLNPAQLREGYENFGAEETPDTSSGENDTSVQLIVNGQTFSGFSKSTSHAEIDALNKILTDKHWSLDELIAVQNKTVKCEQKPCCYRCSIVLGLLGFQPVSNTTRKTASGMGQTQWTLPTPLGDEMRAKYGDIVRLLSCYGNLDEMSKNRFGVY